MVNKNRPWSPWSRAGVRHHRPDACFCKCPLVDVLSVAAFALQQLSGVIKQTGCPAKPQVFPSW